ncbi:hypothetical protein GE061_003726 [Apolygus lucorum]|uniref:Uncharacterized protein n=1 Tax=Apolygus lucorum TaxID=248454 RepID=A0A6A4K3A0_APOLU|nr:hypothetical protein GE061_003726 [Apolygus lucorum]
MQMADCSNYRLKTIDRNFSKADEPEVNRKFQEALLEAELDESPPSVTSVLRQLDVKECLPVGFQDALLPVRQLDVKESRKLLSESNQDALLPVTQGFFFDSWFPENSIHRSTYSSIKREQYLQQCFFLLLFCFCVPGTKIRCT